MEDPKKLTKAQAEKIASGAMDEILNQDLVSLIKNAKPEDLEGVNPEVEIRKTTALPPTCWVHSPGKLELLSVAYSRLVKQAGKHVKRVERVHAKFLKGTKLLVINPALDTDLTAYEVKRYDGASSAVINLSDLFLQRKLSPDTGWKERFDVFTMPEGSALGKGLFIDLSKLQERKRISQKKEEDENQNQEATKKQATKKKGGKAERGKSKGRAPEVEPRTELKADSPQPNASQPNASQPNAKQPDAVNEQ